MKFDVRYIPVFFCFSLFTFYYSLLNAQSKAIDSLLRVLNVEKEDSNKVNTLISLSDYLENSGKRDTSVLYAFKAQQLAEKEGLKNGMINACRNIAEIYDSRENYTTSLEYYLEELRCRKEIGDTCTSSIATNFGKIASDYFELGDYPDALSYHLKGLKIFEAIKDTEDIAAEFGNLGRIYDEEGQYADALDYDLKALKTFDALRDSDKIAPELSNIGSIYKAQSHYQKALDYFLQALKINEKLGNKQLQIVVLLNTGDIYVSQKNYVKALENANKGLKLSMETGFKLGMAASYGELGEIDTRTGKFNEAEEYLKKSMAGLDSLGEKNNLLQATLLISRLYDTTERYQLAFEYYKKAMTLKDTLFNLSKSNTLTRKELTYKFEMKQATDKAEQDKKDAVQKIIIWTITGGLLLVIVFAGFIFRSLHLTKKQKTEIEIKNKVIQDRNKDILDSINYAKRLQDAILPPVNLIKQTFPESFVLYKPKDIIAGDFYWMEKAGDTILIAAADCTGHGVPGALISVVCSNALNRAMKEFHITEPGKILDKTRELLLETFEKSESNVQDGMDISLCSFEMLKQVQHDSHSELVSESQIKATWSGAYNSLWYIQDKEFKEVEGDKQPIGKNDKPLPFKTYTINLTKGDSLYLFTDGYADQFGGTKGKKFKYKQLQLLLMANSELAMEEQKEQLDKEFENWKGALEQVDDVLVIGIRV